MPVRLGLTGHSSFAPQLFSFQHFSFFSDDRLSHAKNSSKIGPKPCRAQSVFLVLSAAGKDLQPEPFEQSHAHDVLVFVADGNVVEENSFQFETKPAVEIDISHVDVARMDVDLVQVPDHESIIKKAERRPFPDPFALRPGLAHQLFHLEFPRRRIDVLATDDSHRLVVVVDAEIVPSWMGEILLQLAFILRKCRHEAFADRRDLQPRDDLANDWQLQRTKRYVLDDKLFAFRPFVLHRCQRKDSVVILHAFGGFPSLCQEIVEQVRRDPEDLVLPHAVIDEFVVKAFRDQFQHPIALLLAGDFFIALLVHRSDRPHYFSFATKVQAARAYFMAMLFNRFVEFAVSRLSRRGCWRRTSAQMPFIFAAPLYDVTSAHDGNDALVTLDANPKA